MGNYTTKNPHGSTGSPLDFFHTAPTTPSAPELSATALPSAAATLTTQQSTPVMATAGSISHCATSTVSEQTQKVSAPSERAVTDGLSSSESGLSDAVDTHGKAAVNPVSVASPPPSADSPPEQSCEARDSGLKPQAAAERAEDRMTLVFLNLMEHYQVSQRLTPHKDGSTAAEELLRCLVTERDELMEEVNSLRETLRTERMEWHQFQSDLQVAVSVADRLRAESDHTLCLLQQSHRAVEDQLAQALSGQQEKDRELQSLRAEHRDVCQRLSEVTLQQQQDRAELDALRTACRIEEPTQWKKVAERQDSSEGRGAETQKDGAENPSGDETQAVNAEKQNDKENQEAAIKGDNPEEAKGTACKQVRGKGVAEGYLRSLAAVEEEEGRKQRDPRAIVRLSERSWSLSRLPLPADSSPQNGTAQNTSTTLPLCKKEEAEKVRRLDRLLHRQDSWSSFPTGNQDGGQKAESIQPQDGYSALLRRHGGSRRNSLLRWCQTRTQGYENIEITNFSSSWEDGLAFCAVYHSFLPTRIPFASLDPADKKKNLDLAFQTGESVGITATLTADEMLKAGGPDWQKVLGYVESIFRHFEM